MLAGCFVTLSLPTNFERKSFAVRCQGIIQFSLQSVEIKKLEKDPSERTAMNAVKPLTLVLNFPRAPKRKNL